MMRSVTTMIPTATEVSVPPTGSTAIKKYSITEADVVAIEAKRGLKVLDIHDKKQVEAVEQLHREAKKGRTTVDRERLEANRELKRIIEESVEWNNNAAAALQSRLNPIEAEALQEIERVEALQEAERLAAKNKLLNDRKAALAEAVGEFTDMLAPYPDDYLANVPESGFKPLLESLPVQVAVRRAAAEQQRLAKEAADKAERDRLESDAKAEALRLKQQAIEDQQRKADQEALDAKVAAFEKQQAAAAELQRQADEARAARIAQENADRLEREAVQRAEAQSILDAQNAELARQRAEIETKRLAYEAEMTRLAKEADERVRVRLEADAKAKEEERLRLKAENDALVAKAEAAVVQAMRPDIEKLCSWITDIENFADDEVPEVSPLSDALMAELHRDLAGCIDAMRGRLT